MRTLAFLIAASLLHGASAPKTEVRVGEITGAEWLSRTGEFFLYATGPEKNRDTVLYVDDVARLALAVATAGDFAFSLEQTGRQMQIRYLPANVEEKAAAALRSTTVEDTLLKTDRILKDIAQGRKVADGLRLGASELFLCGQAMEEWIRSGKTFETYPMVQYVTFFELTARYRFDRFQGVGVWFDEPRILVRAASREQGAEPSVCVQQFAEGLSNRMDELLKHPRTGPEFRRLRALLVLTKAFGWAARLLVPFDRAHLAAITVREIHAEPVPVRELPLVISMGGRKPQSIMIRGGVMLSWNPEFGFPAPAPRGPLTTANQGSRIEGKAAGRAGVSVLAAEPVTIDGRKLLRIDLTGILGLKRRAP
jgi:hypothetical protein